MQIDVEGAVDNGILAASWSPDDSLLSLVSGAHRGIMTDSNMLKRSLKEDGKLIVMTSTLDVLYEKAIHTAEFGEGKVFAIT